jgi:hypothetical protein
MSDIKLSVRLMGEIPENDDLHHLLGTSIQIHRNPDRPGRGVVLFALTERIDADNQEEHQLVGEHMRVAADILRTITPALAKLDPSKVSKEFRISTVRTTDQGGFRLPVSLIKAISDADLFIDVSITIVFDDARE